MAGRVLGILVEMQVKDGSLCVITYGTNISAC